MLESVFNPLYIWSACTYVSETRYIYSLLDSRDSDDIFKLTGSKVKVRERQPWKSCERDIASEPVKGFELKLTHILPTFVP